MKMRFGSADAMPVAARSVSSAPWSETPAGSCTRLNSAWPVARIVAPTRSRAFVQTTGSAPASQLTMICCGAMTCGRPSMTCVTRETAPAGNDASANSATSEPTTPLLPTTDPVIDQPRDDSRRCREQHGEGGALAGLALDAELPARVDHRNLHARPGPGLRLDGKRRALHLDPRCRAAGEQRIAARQPHRDARA